MLKNQVVSVTYFDQDWNREFASTAVLIKSTPKTIQLHFKNNHLFSVKRTIKKVNIRSVEEMGHNQAMEFCKSCTDLHQYIIK